jgi:hypothetical protein
MENKNRGSGNEEDDEDEDDEDDDDDNYDGNELDDEENVIEYNDLEEESTDDNFGDDFDEGDENVGMEFGVINDVSSGNDSVDVRPGSNKNDFDEDMIYDGNVDSSVYPKEKRKREMNMENKSVIKRRKVRKIRKKKGGKKVNRLEQNTYPTPENMLSVYYVDETAMS